MRRVKPLDFMLFCSVLVLGTVTAILTKQNLELKERINQSAQLPDAGSIPDDWKAVPIAVRNLQDERESLNLAERSLPTLLFVFSTSCPHCEHNLPIWSIIAKNLEPDRCVVVGLSSDNVKLTDAFARANQIPFSVYSIEDSSFRSNYKVGGVPHTVLVSSGGMIKYVWRGRLQADMIAEILQDVTDVRDL